LADFADFDPKLVAMATSLERSEKESWINNLRPSAWDAENARMENAGNMKDGKNSVTFTL